MISGQTRSERWRRLQIGKLQDLLENNEKEIIKALQNDLGKPSTEAMFEIIALKQELNLTKKYLSKWMREKRISVPVFHQPGQAFIRLEPLGCVLIIGPWNYPFSLTMQPLISALAAGNTAVLKPSEHAPNTSSLIVKLVGKYFENDVVKVVEGDGSVAAKLVDQSFDHIFFTGGSSIGRMVMASAAKNLTPVTLELGGKSPAIIVEGSDPIVTSRRLIWGKGLNAGQTCIAPDYLLIQEKIRPMILKSMASAREELYGKAPLDSNNLTRIVNNHHFQRLNKLLEDAKSKGQIILGGEVNKSQRLIAPTLIEVTDKNDPLMQEEIFGPLLPILSVQDLDSAITKLQQSPHPLALYMFGGSEKQQQMVLENTSSGSVCFNDVVMQAGIPQLPFGGVGESGMGRYHGLAGFKTFSNQRSILKKSFSLDLKLRYPPYGGDMQWLTKLIG